MSTYKNLSRIRFHNVTYFLGMFVLIWGCGQIIGIIFLNLTPNVQKILLSKEKINNAELFFSLILGPILETSILIYSLLISGQIIKNKTFSRFFAIVPICVLHSINYWQLPFIVALPFYFEIMAYSRFREQWSVVKSMIAVVILHSLSNLLTFYATNSLS